MGLSSLLFPVGLFFFRRVHTCSGTHLPSYPVGAEVKEAEAWSWSLTSI